MDVVCGVRAWQGHLFLSVTGSAKRRGGKLQYDPVGHDIGFTEAEDIVQSCGRRRIETAIPCVGKRVGDRLSIQRLRQQATLTNLVGGAGRELVDNGYTSVWGRSLFPST